MCFTLPQSVIVLGGDAVRVGDGLREALPDLTIVTDGSVPRAPYAVIGFSPGSAIADYPDVSWVHISGAGADGMLQALRNADLRPALMTRTVGQLGRQIGEYVLSYWLADLQKHRTRAELQVASQWDAESTAPQMIRGRSALIIGTGGVGSGVAAVLSVLGMRCTGVSRGGQGHDGFDAVIALRALPDRLPDFDLIVGALPLTADTDGVLDRDLFKRLDQALFINVGRGATANIADVLQALDSNHLRHAVLDVLPTEPWPSDDPLWVHPDVTITPHVSGLTLPGDTVEAFVSAYRALERGEQPALIVDPAAGY